MPTLTLTMCGISAVATLRPFFSCVTWYIALDYRRKLSSSFDPANLRKGFGNDLRRPYSTLVVDDHINHLLRVIGDCHQVQVAGTDQAVSFQTIFHPAQQPF